MDAQSLQKWLKVFAYRIVPLCESLPAKEESGVIGQQLMWLAYSAAAKYGAVCKAQSKRSFTAKPSVALEEMYEFLFWLEAIADIKLIGKHRLEKILNRADELTRILAASGKTALGIRVE
jgi:four helix bundle protein